MSNINPIAQYFTVTRGTSEAMTRAIKGIDLLMFPCKTPVFDEPDLAEQFCQRFNNAQKALGQPIALDGGLAIALAAA